MLSIKEPKSTGPDAWFSAASQHGGKKMIGQITGLSLLIFFLANISACDKFSEQSQNRGAQQVEQPVLATDFGNYYALIIGINAYNKWPKLKYAKRDAENIRSVLTTHYTFDDKHVTYLLDEQATRENIEKELRRILETLEENDNLLIYYAGHGQLDPLTETGYWIPVDGKLDVESSWIMFTHLQSLLSATKVKAKNIVLLTDSCYGGALTRSGPTPGHKSPADVGYPLYEKKLKSIAKKRSRQVIASGGADVTVPDKSEFAKLIVEALQSNQYQLIDMEMLFNKEVYPRLSFAGQQTPAIARIASGSGDNGQFVFVKKQAAQEVADVSGAKETPPAERGLEPVTTPSKPPSDETTPPVIPTVKPKGMLTIKSNVSGDTIYIDESAKGSSQLDVELDAGRHIVRVEKQGYSTYSTRIDLAQGEKLIVNAELKPKQVPFPIVELYTASPNELDQNGSATLNWRTRNTASVEIVGIGNVALSGNASVTPPTNTVYKLIAKNKEGREAKSEVTVTVRTVPDPVIEDFSATTETISIGQKVILNWKTANVDKVELKGVGPVKESGRHSISPKQTTSYTLVAQNTVGKTTEKVVTINVVVPDPVIITFQANKTTIKPGEEITLNWQTQNAQNIELKPIGKASSTGTHTVSPATTTTYTLMARNSAGKQVTQDIQIVVGDRAVIRPELLKRELLLKRDVILKNPKN